MKRISTVCILSSERRLGSTEAKAYEERSWHLWRNPPSSDYISLVHAAEAPGTVGPNLPVNITGISNTTAMLSWQFWERKPDWINACGLQIFLVLMPCGLKDVSKEPGASTFHHSLLPWRWRYRFIRNVDTHRTNNTASSHRRSPSNYMVR